jgi:hypothetical protein
VHVLLAEHGMVGTKRLIPLFFAPQSSQLVARQILTLNF